VDQVYVMNGWVRGRVHKRPRSLQIIVQLLRPAKQLQKFEVHTRFKKSISCS